MRSLSMKMSTPMQLEHASDMIRMIAYSTQMCVMIMQADHTQRSAGARSQPEASCTAEDFEHCNSFCMEDYYFL